LQWKTCIAHWWKILYRDDMHLAWWICLHLLSLTLSVCAYMCVSVSVCRVCVFICIQWAWWTCLHFLTLKLCVWIYQYVCIYIHMYYAHTHTHIYTHTPSHTSHMHATRSSWALLLENVRLTHFPTKNSQCICLV